MVKESPDLNPLVSSDREIQRPDYLSTINLQGRYHFEIWFE